LRIEKLFPVSNSVVATIKKGLLAVFALHKSKEQIL
jgi:hypothetical protein